MREYTVTVGGLNILYTYFFIEHISNSNIVQYNIVVCMANLPGIPPALPLVKYVSLFLAM